MLAFASCAVLLGGAHPAPAQSTVWDSTISNTHWYVPTDQLLGYVSPNTSFANPTAVGDQTLWTLGVSTNGVFTGTSLSKLAIGPALVTSLFTIQGAVTTSGQITMIFTPSSGPPTVGLGQMTLVNGVTSMEMQMITGDTLLVTHWAYMLPYDPTTFTPPAPQVVLANSVPQWSWTAGTPWRIISPAMFATSSAGKFIVTNYQNGYFWGRGIGPTGSNFTLLGSITPEGKVLLSTISNSALNSAYGNIAGDASAAQMILNGYDSAGNLTGPLTFISLVRPYAETMAATNNRSGFGAAESLYRVAGTSLGLGGAMAPTIDALNNLSGSALTAAVSQTLPVLAGSAAQATYNTQRALQQVVTDRLDDLTVAQHIWLKPFGGAVRQSALNGFFGYRASGGGLAAGIDRAISPTLFLGGVLAYTHNVISGSDNSVPNRLSIANYQAGLYGAYALGPDADAHFQLDTGLNQNSESRSITFMNSAASADYSSYTTHAGLGVRKTVPLTHDLALVPVLRVDFGQVSTGSYGESGAGALNLNVGSQVYRELMVAAGVKSIYRVADHVSLIGNVVVGYNAFNKQAQISAAYAGGGDSFVTYGLDVSPWLYSAGVSLVGKQTDAMDLSLRYDLQASPTGFLNQMASLVFKMKI